MWVKLIQGTQEIYLENDYGNEKIKLLEHLKLGWTLTSSNWFNKNHSPLDWLNGNCIDGTPGKPQTFTLSKMYYNKLPQTWKGPQDMVPGLPPAPPAPPPAPPPVPPPTPPSGKSFNCNNWKCVDPGDGNGKYSTYSECQNVCKSSPYKIIILGIISIIIFIIVLGIYLYKHRK